MPDRLGGPTICSMGQIGVVGWNQETNIDLVQAWRELGLHAALLPPPEAMRSLGCGDVAIGRLDVVQSLDGVEPGLDALGFIAQAGARVLNPAAALLNAHDKLLTALRLELAGVPHPKTVFVAPGATSVSIAAPLVLKPRFGSWGRDVVRCESEADVASALRKLRTRTWFLRQGAVAQALVPPSGFDLRLLIAGGRLVGAVERVAAPGEWRTNFSLGGSRRPVDPPDEAVRLGLAAVAAIGADFVGVDLLPVNGGHVALELNGAVEFDDLYDLPGRDVYLDLAGALHLVPSAVVA
jgi:RimK family alpha-L-glutamate ligase